MVMTFAGEALPPCGALRRAAPRRQRTPRRVPTVPLAWIAIAYEYWGLDQPTTSLVWEAFAACFSSEVVAFRQRLLLWPTVADGAEDLRSHRIGPGEVLKVLELTLREGWLATRLVQCVTEAVLAHVDARGGWKPTR
jgi:hypothetical protein